MHIHTYHIILLLDINASMSFHAPERTLHGNSLPLKFQVSDGEEEDLREERVVVPLVQSIGLRGKIYRKTWDFHGFSHKIWGKPWYNHGFSHKM